MYTFRLNLRTKAIYDDMLALYNKQFNTKFTIELIIPYAVTHFIDHGNASYLKHYNLIKSYFDQSFILEKVLYKQLIKKFINNDITLQDILNTALNLYIVQFKADFIKKAIDINKSLIILSHFHLIQNNYKINIASNNTKFIMTNCPVCGDKGFYINLNNLSIGCYKKRCPTKSNHINDLIGLIEFISKNKYTEIIDIIYDITIKNYSKYISNIETLQERKSVNSDREEFLKYKLFLLQSYLKDESINNNSEAIENKIQSIQEELQKIETDKKEEKKKQIIRNYIMIRNGSQKYDYLINKGFSPDVLKELGVFLLGNDVTKDIQTNDFRYRICYPIYSDKNELVGIQGRSIIDDSNSRSSFLRNDSFFRKYWDSVSKKVEIERLQDTNSFNQLTPEDLFNIHMWDKINSKILNTSGFNKSEYLYLLHKYTKNKIRKEIRIIITEGIKDAIRLYGCDLNLTVVVSSMGCNLSNEQIKLLKYYYPNREIILAYDRDIAGVEGNIKAYFKLLKAGFDKINFVEYREGIKDFGDINNLNIQDTVVSILEKKESYNKYLVNMLKSGLLIDQSILSC